MAGGDATGPGNGPGNGPDGGHEGDEAHRPAAAGGFADQDAGQLAFGHDDASLPWLEGDDDDEEYYEGYSTGRLIAVALLGLLVLGAIAGGIWWAVHRMGAGKPVADGSVVEAPAVPYKQRPANPGGRLVDGTGDTSFAVAEGQMRQVRLGAASPSPATAATKLVKAEAGDSSAAPAATGGVGVQLAAYSTQALAEAGWARLSQQHEMLSGLNHRIVAGQADIGTVYRLQVVAANAAEARALCRNFKAAGLNCQVKN